jgi:hypothetical protein
VARCLGASRLIAKFFSAPILSSKPELNLVGG